MEREMQLDGQEEIPKSSEQDDGNLCESPFLKTEQTSASKSPSEDSVTTKQAVPELIYVPLKPFAQPILSFLRPQEIQKFGSVQRHVQISRHHFRIIGNRGKAGGTLYRALAQAITTEEQDSPIIRQVIAMSLVQCWSTYEKVVVPAYRDEIKGFTPEEIQMKSERDIINSYLRANLREEIEGTFVELLVAAKRFAFDYTVLLVEEDNTFTVVNCQDEEIKSEAKAKHFFIRSGNEFKNWHWEYLAPYNRDAMKIKISAGTFPLNILQVYPFHRGSIHLTKQEVIPKCFENFPTVLALNDGRVYGYFETPKTDIFSNLSVLLYGSEANGQSISDVVKEAKLSQNERKSKKLSALPPIAPEYLEAGDTHDIEVVSKAFSFTYSVYSLDEIGNLVKVAEKPRGYYASKSGAGDGKRSDADMKHYTLLARCRRNYHMEWHILFEVKDPSLRVAHGEEYSSVDLTKLYLNPLQKPFTKKKNSIFGIKYRVLRNRSLGKLKILMGIEKDKEADAKLKSKNAKSLEEGYTADLSGMSTSSGNESDTSCISIHKSTTAMKNSLTNLFWRGSSLMRSTKVAPATDEETTPLDILFF